MELDSHDRTVSYAYTVSVEAKVQPFVQGHIYTLGLLDYGGCSKSIFG